MPAAHGDIGSAVIFARHHGKFGNRGFGIAPQKFRAVADNSVPFLMCAGQVAWHVAQGHERNVESVAKPDEARGFVGSVDVEATGQNCGLVRHEADHAAVEPGETDDDVLRVVLVRFKEHSVVHDAVDHIAHGIAHFRRVWNNFIQFRAQPPGIVFALGARSVFHVVGRQIAEQNLDLLDGVGVVLAGEMCVSAFGIVRHGAAKIFLRGFFARDRADHVRAGDEHKTGVFDHEHEIRHGRRIDRPAGAGPHDRGDLRDHAAGAGIAIEDVAVASQSVHAFLDAGSAAVLNADQGKSAFQRHVHDLADLGGVHFTQGTAP